MPPAGTGEEFQQPPRVESALRFQLTPQVCALTDHHGGEGHSPGELALDELGHEGGEASEQRRQVDLRQHHQQVDGAAQGSQGDPGKTWGETETQGRRLK